ncbi:MAG: WD40 repeat domain-containing protein [bacterium]|nr:WD40 repeat domain-containing protein [bacterium]
MLLLVVNTVSAGGGGRKDTSRGGEAIATFGYPYDEIGWIGEVVMSPTHDTLLFLTTRGIFYLPIADLSASPQALMMDNRISAVAYHPNGLFIAVGDIFGNISVIDALTGDILHTIQPDNQLIYALAYSPDGNTLAIGDGGGNIRLWHIPMGEISIIPNAHDYYVTDVVYYPQAERLISVGGDGLIRLWDVTTTDFLFEVSPTPYISYLNISPDGEHLIASSRNNYGSRFDMNNPDTIEEGEHFFSSTHADFSTDGEWLLLCVGDEIQLWTVFPLQLYAVVGSVSVGSDIAMVDYAYFIPNTDYIVSLNGNHLALWDITQAEIISSDDE